MPSTRKRKSTGSVDNDLLSSSPAGKRRRSSAGNTEDAADTTSKRPCLDVTTNRAARDAKRPRTAANNDDIFGEDEDDAGAADANLIDLSRGASEGEEEGDANKEAAKPKEDTRIKLGSFQCAICMDDATAMTVTHCGHIFCSECLHSAMNVEATREKCPICRTKIDSKDRSAYNSRTKGFWPLELKLMTAKKLGKQKTG